MELSNGKIMFKVKGSWNLWVLSQSSWKSMGAGAPTLTRPLVYDATTDYWREEVDEITKNQCRIFFFFLHTGLSFDVKVWSKQINLRKWYLDFFCQTEMTINVKLHFLTSIMLSVASNSSKIRFFPFDFSQIFSVLLSWASRFYCWVNLNFGVLRCKAWF